MYRLIPMLERRMVQEHEEGKYYPDLGSYKVWIRTIFLYVEWKSQQEEVRGIIVEYCIPRTWIVTLMIKET